MKLIMSLFVFLCLCGNLSAATTNATRVSVFSTTTDWTAVTGLPARQYSVDFIWENADIDKGLLLYYLDGFPCYGIADSVRVWLGKNKKTDGKLRLVCVHKPATINFSWQNAGRDARDNAGTGILTCPVSGDFDLSIDLSKCNRGAEWSEYK